MHPFPRLLHLEDGAPLLTVAQMAEADRRTIAGDAARPGTPGGDLMAAAGRALASVAHHAVPTGPVLVLCGPGNNGGDGFVAAEILRRGGRSVRVALLGDRAKLTGDAARAAETYRGPIVTLDAVTRPDGLNGTALVIDALFGAGLSRPVENVPAAALRAVADLGLPIIAADVPSGLDGDTGQPRGTCVGATATVTFFRKKPGHVLQPGRSLCGAVKVIDIGIPEWVLDPIAPTRWQNGPQLWGHRFPRPLTGGHKYHRGHALVLGGAEMTGAARLAARAARRIGAGLVTLVVPEAVQAIYAADAPGTIVLPEDRWLDQLADPRRNAVLLGPGGGPGPALRDRVLEGLRAERATVLDADALTAFEGASLQDLADALHDRCVLTPHDGEFARLFQGLGDWVQGVQGQGVQTERGQRQDVVPVAPSVDRLTRARAAAAHTGAVVLLKGSDTVVAAPDGRAAINANAPPTLATAGAGDVLAGLIVGLLAQGMPAFEAAAAAAWLHGDTAAARGPGLIAEDLVDHLPASLHRLAFARIGSGG